MVRRSDWATRDRLAFESLTATEVVDVHKRVQELVAYGEACGFVVEKRVDGGGHYLLRHSNGEVVRIPSTPGDRRGDWNAQAEMRRKSGVSPPRANSGRYRRGVRLERYVPAEVRVDSKSHRLAVLRGRFRVLCERVDWCRAEGDRDGAAVAIAELLSVEDGFRAAGVLPPPRKFRVYEAE